jgi:hypothetical protein
MMDIKELSTPDQVRDYSYPQFINDFVSLRDSWARALIGPTHTAGEIDIQGLRTGVARPSRAL